MLRVTSVLQLQSIWEKPSYYNNRNSNNHHNESNANKLTKTTSLSEIANEVLNNQNIEAEVDSIAIADAVPAVTSTSVAAGPAILIVTQSDSEVLVASAADSNSSFINSDAASFASKNVVQPPSTLQVSNSVHSDRGNSIPNMETVENENSLHASSLSSSPSTNNNNNNINVPIIQVISYNDDLLNNKPLPKTPTSLKINTSSTTSTKIITTANEEQVVMTSSSKTPSLKSSSSSSSSIINTSNNNNNNNDPIIKSNNNNNNNDLILQDTTSSISSNSTSSSKKLNIPLTPKEDSSEEDDDNDYNQKKAKRKSSFHFKRYSFLNKPTTTDSNTSPPPSLHSSFHLPPSPSSMFNGANQALKRESSKLNLRRKSLSKKVKKAISNIKLNNNNSPTSPVA